MTFAPVNKSWERFLQLLGVWIIINEGHPVFLVGTWIWYRLLWTQYYWISLLYVVWYVYDYNQDERGGRKWPWFRRQPAGDWAREYFPSRIVKTAELPPDRNYIVAHHPHGILSIAGLFTYAGDSEFSKLFPGIKTTFSTLRMNCLLPFARETFMWAGFCSASKNSLRYILNNEGKGNAIAIIVGGAQEALDAHRGGDYILTLKKRKGFIKEALVNGADIVPSFGFGEVDLYRQVANPPGSAVRNFQETTKRWLGFALPFIRGRGLFQSYFGYLPLRSPVTCVVGAPIRVEKVKNPTNEEISELHSRYVEELTKLFETHKKACGQENRKLILV